MVVFGVGVATAVGVGVGTGVGGTQSGGGIWIRWPIWMMFGFLARLGYCTTLAAISN